ncbi:acyl-[ACP]--phospholipid O-acyltransferase [Thiolinea disciformis]|uniref:acyl-[ACP]--phospholipid O-acyltransferase n=1 Tax=Thiolinea disciformis TaxID=125614 RepID=UPI00035CF45D|nr:acyl-[ACP]--phospholipid O-acyltransferase [Thiolinea disciformis]
MWQLLRVQGFSAFITMAFLNAFVIFGHTIILQNTIFKLANSQEQVIRAALANALLLIPFVLSLTPAGFVSDKYPKVTIMRYTAWGSLATTLLITLSYYMGWFWLSFSLTFVLGLLAAFYSPARTGYIRELIGESRLTQGNAFLQSATMIAILLSSFFFSMLFEMKLANEIFSSESQVLALIASLGWALFLLSGFVVWCSYQLPLTRSTNHELIFDKKRYVAGQFARANFQTVYRSQIIWLTIIALSVFWAVSQFIVLAYPAYAKQYLNIHNTVTVQALIACSGIGIMLGSLWAGKLSRNYIEIGLIPVGALGIMINVALITWLDSLFFQALNFFSLGIMGGLFVVPLNALMQYHAPLEKLGRVLSTFNLVSNILMLSFIGIAVMLTLRQVDSQALFTFLSFLVSAGALYTVYKMPHSLLRFLVGRLFKVRYRLKVLGFNNLPSKGGVLLLGNHISWIDWALVQIASPRAIRFVMDKGYYEQWYLKGILSFFGVIPISSGSSEGALSEVKRYLNEGDVVCLFPEGTISRTGHLSEFKRGYEKAVKDTNAIIIPFYLHGLWGSRFSRSSGFLRETRPSGLKRDLIVSFGQPLPPDTKAPELKQKVFELSFETWQVYSHMIDPIPVTWLHVAKRLGMRMAATDVLGEPLGNYRFMTAVFRFAKLIKQGNPEQNVGILLPTSMGGTMANMAVLSLAKTVVNINYTASPEAIKSSVEQAGLKRLYTSKLFLKRLAEQRSLDIQAILPNTEMVFMDDMKAAIPKHQLLLTMAAVILLPARLLELLYLRYTSLELTAAILFSSGSEGTPKGVELSHRNLAINARQVADMLNTREDDVLMATLPSFHAFGLLANILMPLSEGIPIVCHPDPTDAVNIAKGVAKYEATVLFGTSTFLRLYARNQRVHPLMFQSLRYVVAGAEKLAPEVRQLFSQRFNKSILEGYGMTETSPVASVNVPDKLDSSSWKIQMGSREGTVGMPLPGTTFRIVDPETMETLAAGTDGLILAGGPQVMKGYLNAPEKTAQVIAELDGKRWYKTGDKGHLDEDGFLTIVDRYSRFAKLGGEMVSLTAVEQAIRKSLQDPELDIVAINCPDEKKGEKIILLLGGEHEPKAVRDQLLADGSFNGLMLPAEIKKVAEVPKLGSGKTDFATSRKLAQSLMS